MGTGVVHEEATRAAQAVSEALDQEEIGIAAASIALVRILKLLHEQTGTEVGFEEWIREIESTTSIRRGGPVAQA